MQTTTSQREHAAVVPAARGATRATVSTFGVVAGLAGIEHGIGEVLQGSVAPDGIVILSWPGWEAFELLGGEPAMTVVDNLLATGILATLVSLVFIIWATVFVRSKYGGTVMIALSLVMLLVGGGFGPPILGIIVGVAATRIDAPPTWWGAHLSGGARRFLAKLWAWSLAAGLIAWLSLLPGTVLLDYFFDVSEMEFAVILLSLCILSAFGLLVLTILAGFARDLQLQTGLRQESSKGGFPKGG